MSEFIKTDNVECMGFEKRPRNVTAVLTVRQLCDEWEVILRDKFNLSRALWICAMDCTYNVDTRRCREADDRDFEFMRKWNRARQRVRDEDPSRVYKYTTEDANDYLTKCLTYATEDPPPRYEDITPVNSV
jgi:hypothetical protein